MLWTMLSWAHSLFSCAGTHDLRTKTVFSVDPNGPDRFTGFPPGSGGPAFGKPDDPINCGRYETFESCRRCGLRPIDGKYEIW